MYIGQGERGCFNVYWSGWVGVFQCILVRVGVGVSMYIDQGGQGVSMYIDKGGRGVSIYIDRRIIYQSRNDINIEIDFVDVIAIEI